MRAVHPLQSALYALLAINTLWFLVVAPWTKGLDSLAWFTLLLLAGTGGRAAADALFAPKQQTVPGWKKCTHSA